MPQPSPARTPPLTAGIVLYHSDLPRLRQTLVCLVAARDRASAPMVVTVVDQSCDPDYSRAAREIVESVVTGPDLELHYRVTEANGGYGVGHNLATATELGESHLILNPDVELSPDALSLGLQTLAENPDVVALAPRGFDGEGQEEFLAKRFPSVTVLFLRAFAPVWIKNLFLKRLHEYEMRDLPSDGGLQDVPLLSGCCMLVRGEALRLQRGFDERFFLYFEDYDLSLRLAKRGRVVRVPQMTIVHHGGNASAKGFRHIRWFGAGAVRFFSTWGWRLY